MVPGVLVMTTYKLVVIPHPPPVQSGVNSTSKGLMMSTSTDDRYTPFGHLLKEYVQVRRINSLEAGTLQFCAFLRLGQSHFQMGVLLYWLPRGWRCFRV